MDNYVTCIHTVHDGIYYIVSKQTNKQTINQTLSSNKTATHWISIEIDATFCKMRNSTITYDWVNACMLFHAGGLTLLLHYIAILLYILCFRLFGVHLCVCVYFYTFKANERLFIDKFMHI